jgi:NTP pyrophosphatase (non-canonical NTP hydrolase)
MTFDEYQKQAMTTAIIHDNGLNDLMHWVLGVNGEAGEIAEKLKKVIRDRDGELTEDDKKGILKEVGDVLWYIAALANHLDASLEKIAEENLAKLADRNRRGVIQGKGDNR